MSINEMRQRVWNELVQVAIPDSRFNLDFNEYIPNFPGSSEATDRLTNLEAYKSANLVLITPDNCLEELRYTALLDGKQILVPTYGIRRGFCLLDPNEISPNFYFAASLLDSMERLCKFVALSDIEQLGTVDLLVTGASFISKETGARGGKGHGFFDLEWAMLFEINAVNLNSQIVGFVHDCQVVDDEITLSKTDTTCDLIITPTRTIQVTNVQKPTIGVVWNKLEENMLEQIPPLRSLRARRKT